MGGELESSKEDEEHANVHESNGSPSNTLDGKYLHCYKINHIKLWISYVAR